AVGLSAARAVAVRHELERSVGVPGDGATQTAAVCHAGSVAGPFPVRKAVTAHPPHDRGTCPWVAARFALTDVDCPPSGLQRRCAIPLRELLAADWSATHEDPPEREQGVRYDAIGILIPRAGRRRPSSCCMSARSATRRSA